MDSKSWVIQIISSLADEIGGEVPKFSSAETQKEIQDVISQVDPLIRNSLLSKLLEIRHEESETRKFKEEYGEDKVVELNDVIRKLSSMLTSSQEVGNDMGDGIDELVEKDIDDELTPGTLFGNADGVSSGDAALAAGNADEDDSEVLKRLNAVLSKPLAAPSSVGDEIVKYHNPFLRVMPIWYETHSIFNMGRDLPSYFESPPVSAIPKESQEFYLVEDLIYALAGFGGRYIIPDSRNKFIVSEFVDTPSRESVERILPLCDMHIEIQAWVDEHLKFEYGLVNHAAANHIRDLLKDYLVFVARLGKKHTEESLSLADLWFQVQPSFVSQSELRKFTQGVESSEATGARVLNVAYDLWCGGSGNPTGKQVFSGLLEASLAPYLEFISDWIYLGKIVDPYGEFFILEEKSSSGEWKADDWEKRYSIDERRVPKFIRSKVGDVYLSGKYLNVISAITSVSFASKKKLPYFGEELRFSNMVDEALHSSSKMILDLLLQEHELLTRIDLLKKYYLFHHGDCLNLFLEIADDELAKPASNISINRLEGLLNLSFPGQDDLHVKMEAGSIQEFVMHILLTTGMEFDRDISKLTMPAVSFNKLNINMGYDTFSIDYSLQWPISLVVTRGVLLKYQILFRHLLQAKIIAKSTRRVWHTCLPAKSFSPSSMSLSCFLKELIHFEENLLSHFFHEVIDIHWRSFKSSIQSFDTIDELLESHNDFLDNCLRDCMLTSKRMVAVLYKLLEICRNFSLFALRRLDGAHVSSDTLMKRLSSDEVQKAVETYSTDFHTRLSELNTLLGLHSANNNNFLHFAAKLDYNSFYSGNRWKKT